MEDLEDKIIHVAVAKGPPFETLDPAIDSFCDSFAKFLGKKFQNLVSK